MEISIIHSTIFRLALGMSCLKWDIFMFYSLDLMSEHPVHVSGHTIFKVTNNIPYQLYWLLKVYTDLKALNLCLASVVKYFFIHRPIILDLRFCWIIFAFFSAPSSPSVWWRPKYTPELSAHKILQCESTMTCLIYEQDRVMYLTSVGA